MPSHAIIRASIPDYVVERLDFMAQSVGVRSNDFTLYLLMKGLGQDLDFFSTGVSNRKEKFLTRVAYTRRKKPAQTA